MNKEKEETEKGISLSALLTLGFIIVVVVVGGLILSMSINFMHNESMDHAHNTIDDMQNVSEDYRQGWNDCLADIHDHYSKAQNVTSATANNCI